MHPAQCRLIDAPYIDHLPLEEYGLPKALKSAGYHTWHVGKWHLGNRPYYPNNQGFDLRSLGMLRGYRATAIGVLGAFQPLFTGRGGNT